MHHRRAAAEVRCPRRHRGAQHRHLRVLCTTQDFHTLLALRKLGGALWLIGDPASQLTAIGDHWHGTDLTGDISDTAMLRSAVDCQRCVFTEPRRCDARLFTWLSNLPPRAGGGRKSGTYACATSRGKESLHGRRRRSCAVRGLGTIFRWTARGWGKRRCTGRDNGEYYDVCRLCGAFWE